MAPAEAGDVGSTVRQDGLDDRGVRERDGRFEVHDRRLRRDRSDHLDIEVHLAGARTERNLARDEWNEKGPGHIIKGRYTSLQADVGSTEEHLEALAEAESVDGMPVVAAALHSQVPGPVMWFIGQTSGRGYDRDAAVRWGSLAGRRA